MVVLLVGVVVIPLVVVHHLVMVLLGGLMLPLLGGLLQSRCCIQQKQVCAMCFISYFSIYDHA